MKLFADRIAGSVMGPGHGGDPAFCIVENRQIGVKMANLSILAVRVR